MHASHRKGSVHGTSRFRVNRAKLIMHTSDVQARGQEMILLSEHAIYDFPSSYLRKKVNYTLRINVCSNNERGDIQHESQLL